MKQGIEWLLEAVETAAQTGFKDNGEYWRATYTKEDAKVLEFLNRSMEEAGMTTYFDNIGNLFGRIEGKTDEVFMAGSHRDTVRQGGKYDGILGVLTAIRSVGDLYKEYGQPEKTVEVVATCEEESSRFNLNYVGSRYMCGYVKEDELKEKDSEGISFEEALKTAGYFRQPLSNKPHKFDRFLELHIEQGSVLENLEKEIGIVESIVGLYIVTVTIKGVQSHAGTTLMDMRKDPMPAAADFITTMTNWAYSHKDNTVSTVGRIEAKPGGMNIIPNTVTFSIDTRSTEKSLLMEAKEILKGLADKYKDKLQVEINVMEDDDPVKLDDEGVEAMVQIAKEEGYDYKVMHSGAGHDSQVIAEERKTNMIFIPSVKGISHAREEFTKAKDIENGLNFMKAFIKKYAWK